MIENLLIEILFLVGFLLIAGYALSLFREIDLENLFQSFKAQIIAGGLLGLLGMLMMHWHVGLNEQIMVDFRHLPIVIAATFFQLPGAFTSALVISIGRLILGGLTNISFVGAASTLFIGVSCAMIINLRLPFRKLNFIYLNIVSFIIIYSSLYIKTTTVSSGEQNLQTVFFLHFSLSLFATLIIYSICNYIYENNQLIFNFKKISSQLATLVKNSHSGTIVETRDQKIEIVNDRFYDMFQIPKTKQLVGHDAGEIFAEHMEKITVGEETFYTQKHELVTNNVPVFAQEFVLSDGRVMEYDFIPVSYADQQAIIWNFRDVTGRKKGEEILLESTRNYRRLFEKYESVVENVVEVIFQADSEGRWTFLNRSWEKIMGYSVEETLGKSYIDYVHPDDREKMQQLYRPLMNGEVESLCYEFRYIRKDGKQLWLEAFAKLMVDCHGKTIGMIGTLFDITGRKVMEEKIAKSEQRYKSLFKHNRCATYHIDKQGFFIELNDASELITGYKTEELIGKSFVEIIRESYIVQTIGFFERSLHGESMTYETEIVKKTGEFVSLSVNMAPVFINYEITGVIGVAFDITKQKEYERKLIASENRYRTLIDLSPEGIFVHSELQIEFINDKGVELLGLKSPIDVVGKSLLDFLHHEDRPKAAENMRHGFAKSIYFTNFYEVRFIKANGKTLVANIGTKMIDYNGKIAMLGVIHDITMNKRVEKRLKEANDMLRKISSIDGLTGIPNRRYYDMRLKEEWQSALKNKQYLSLVMLDIDQFKNYNDSLGHLQGDQCLKELATTIQNCVEQHGFVVARYGGEEFSVIMQNTTKHAALSLAEKIRHEIAILKIPHPNSNVAPYVTISVGVASVKPTKHTDSQELVRQADKALYLSKAKGRNQVNVYVKR